MMEMKCRCGAEIKGGGNASHVEVIINKWMDSHEKCLSACVKCEEKDRKIETLEELNLVKNDALKEDQRRKMALEAERNRLAEELDDTKAAFKMLQEGAEAHG